MLILIIQQSLSFHTSLQLETVEWGFERWLKDVSHSEGKRSRLFGYSEHVAVSLGHVSTNTSDVLGHGV